MFTDLFESQRQSARAVVCDGTTPTVRSRRLRRRSERKSRAA